MQRNPGPDFIKFQIDKSVRKWPNLEFNPLKEKSLIQSYKVTVSKRVLQIVTATETERRNQFV